MCLFEILFGMSSSNSNNNKHHDDGLEDWQRDLVKSGEYEPYDFEEESMDDDSYYNEDD